MSEFNWNDLRYFLAVARTGTLTAAARRLGADHATVSRRISALEDVLRVTLFDRGPGGYTPTVFGIRLREAAEAMESSALRAHDLVADADLAVSGAVRIGAPDGFGSSILAAGIGELSDRHPDLDVQIVAMPRIFSLSKREADIAIGLSRPQEGRLVARKLTDYQLCLYGASRYLAERPPITSLDDLRSHSLIGYIDDLIFAPELNYLQAIDGIVPRIRSSSIVAQLTATSSGAGLCILPCFLAHPVSELVPVLPTETVITRSFWMIVHEDVRTLARVRVTADFIVDLVQRDQRRFLPM